MKLPSLSKDTVVIGGGVLLILIVIITTIVRGLLIFPQQNSSVITSEDRPEKIYSYIQVSELYQKKLDGTSLFIIDLRDPVDHAIDHIEGSQNISPSQLALQLPKFAPDEMIVLVGYAAFEELAEQGAKILDGAGIKNYFILSGGFEAWSNKSLQTVSWGDPTQFVDQSKVIYIQPEEVRQLLSADNPPLLLDVREAYIYSEDHRDESLNIPLAEIETRKQEIPRTRDIVVYGVNPLESFRGGSKLFDLSLYNVKTLQGSYKDISQE
jgi:rhodanese-related sulfurtransferase